MGSNIFFFVTIFILCYTLVEGRKLKLDDANTIFGGSVDSRMEFTVGGHKRATIDRAANHGGSHVGGYGGIDKSPNDNGGRGSSEGRGDASATGCGCGNGGRGEKSSGTSTGGSNGTDGEVNGGEGWNGGNGGEVNGGEGWNGGNGGEVSGSSGCLSVGRLVTLCGKGIAFLVVIGIIAALVVCIACYIVCCRRR